jgi:glucose/arabinose dehydrogenase
MNRRAQKGGAGWLLSALMAIATLAGFARADDAPVALPAPIAPYDSDADNRPPMPAEEAAQGFKRPPGFHVAVFAAEPAVRNPIAMTFDPRGRLWIAENDTYAEPGKQFDERLRDRVIIYEDQDGDGKSDRRTVFSDAIQRLTSVEVGHGGVWLMCPPSLLFIPDRDGDDRPDGPAEVILDGFTVPPENHHNFANGLTPIGSSLRPSPAAPQTPGATTGTPSASCSSSTRSTGTSGIWRPGRITCGPTPWTRIRMSTT